ncbi:MAG: hypothetical protein KatS3mg113_0058 [Planctomycetaceae bacterium]|nr:MAG: hypothetical protein KatS3mg113_0058 [Planctomycetaceae bacterium]
MQLLHSAHRYDDMPRPNRLVTLLVYPVQTV